MTRVFVCSVLACCVYSQAANGFPSPKRDPPTNAELIVGIWEIVLFDGKAPPEAMFVEFAADGSFRRFSIPGSGDWKNGQYEVAGITLIGTSDSRSEQFHIKSITAKKLILHDAKNVAEIAELRKR
jgi:hypothetical protein